MGAVAWSPPRAMLFCSAAANSEALLNVAGNEAAAGSAAHNAELTTEIIRNARIVFRMACLPSYGLTVTFTCALVQQHWKPRPPSPDQSLAVTSRMYSPGSLNVALVLNFAATVLPGGALNSTFSSGGFSLEKVTVPGPRNMAQVIVIGGPGGDFLAPSSTLASSAAHTVKG